MTTISNPIQKLETDLQEAKVSKDSLAAELKTQIAVNEAQAAQVAALTRDAQEHAATIETLRKELKVAEGRLRTLHPFGAHSAKRPRKAATSEPQPAAELEGMLESKMLGTEEEGSDTQYLLRKALKRGKMSSWDVFGLVRDASAHGVRFKVTHLTKAVLRAVLAE